ncbi:hypothetical protein [Acinetobacter faecalis]|uniref:Uncharacterized protein n=1 Tax=Acinetobacter faecalis TaxID=2665161 RepID=A0ABU5GLN8_9GAMM|nr:hypothetical protein [Acinetobacter faecalis]MDY6551419.1 hypothetical protein [Acinetobacter faecalis]
MSYTYSSITRVLLIKQDGREKLYKNIDLFGIEDCIKDFVNSWGFHRG